MQNYIPRVVTADFTPNIPFGARASMKALIPWRTDYHNQNLEDEGPCQMTQRRNIAHRRNILLKRNDADYQNVMKEFKERPLPERRGASLSRLLLPTILVTSPEPMLMAFAERPSEIKNQNLTISSRPLNDFDSPDEAEIGTLKHQESNRKYVRLQPRVPNPRAFSQSDQFQLVEQ
ncbi:hypothetical protein ACTXT7_009464 [Hymenolepis weldensis]